MYVLCTSLVFVGLLSPLLTLSARAAESPGILFSEVDWGGSLRNSADEWLELANLGGSSVDLSGWNVTGAGTSGSSLILPQGSTIPSFGTFLIANYAPSDSSTLANQVDYVTSAVSLPNSKLTLSLVDQNGLIVDSLDDAGTPDYGSTTPIFSSMERNLSTLAWQNPLSSTNLLDASQLGSPGLADVPIPILITEPTTEFVIEPILTAPENPPPAIEPIAEPSQSSALVANQTTELSSADFTITDTLTPIPVTIDPVIIPEPVLITDPGESSNNIVENPAEPMAVIEEQTASTEPIIDAPVMTEPSTTALLTLSEPLIIEAVLVPTVEPLVDIVAIIEPTIDSAPAIAPPITESIIEPATVEPIPIIDPIIIPPVIVEPIIEPKVTSQDTSFANDVSSQSSALTANSPSQLSWPLLINELLPSPSTGFDEWVEVYNPNTVAVDVSGWTITDSSGKATSLTGTILAGSYQSIINPSGKLNNDGDTVNLINASGELIDSVSYGTASLVAPKHDQSLSYSGDTWLISTTPTPGSANAAISEVPPAVEQTVTSEPSQSSALATNKTTNLSSTAIKLAPVTTTSVTASSATKRITAPKLTVTKAPVAKVAAKPTTKKKSVKVSKSPQLITTLTGVADNILVTYQGTVIATPGTFGKQLAFLGGATLYMDNADWPTLALGDVIKVTGLTSTANGEQRIKLTGASAISTVGHADLNSPPAIEGLGEALRNEPSLVTVRGTVVTRNGSKLTLKVDGQDIIVDAYKTTGIVWSSLTSSELTITGVLRHLNNENVLMPRSAADVVENHEAVIAAATNTRHSSPIPLKPIAGGGLVTGTLGALGYWFTKSRTLIPAV